VLPVLKAVICPWAPTDFENLAISKLKIQTLIYQKQFLVLELEFPSITKISINSVCPYKLNFWVSPLYACLCTHS